jgi:hypothetical protein
MTRPPGSSQPGVAMFRHRGTGAMASMWLPPLNDNLNAVRDF